MKKKLFGICLVLTLILTACGNAKVEEKGEVDKEIETTTQENKSNDSKTVEKETKVAETEEKTEEKTQDEKLSIYLSGPEAMMKKLETSFEKERGDVVDFLLMSCGQVRNKVWTEKEAGNIQADIVWGSDPMLFNKLDNEGLLATLDLENEKYIDESIKAESDNYLMVNERYVTLMYNSDNISDCPKSYEQLKNEKYANKVVMADAGQSATAFSIASCIYQIENNDINYFKGLKDNGIKLSKSNGQVPSLIIEGQFDIGVGPHDAFVRLTKKAKKEGYEIPLKLIWPEEGAIAIRRPMGIIKDENRSEENQKIAEEFVNFMLSKEAQKITEQFGFVSVRNDIENTYLPKDVKKQLIDWNKATECEGEFKKAYEEIF